jgi:hypothetical protein
LRPVLRQDETRQLVLRRRGRRTEASEHTQHASNGNAHHAVERL